jgi:hypothetical protein
MSIVQTTLIFVGIPVAFMALMTALVYARSNERTSRYRPGGPWQFEPVWYLPHPEHQGPVSSLHSGQHQPDGARPALAGRVAEPVTASGGASGEW